MIPTGYARVTFGFTGVGVPTGAAVVFAVQNVGGLSPTQIANDVLADFTGAGWAALYSSDVTLSSVLVKLGPDDTGPSAEISASVVGTNGAVTAVPNAAYLLHKNTASGGRRGRGRMFIPGLPEGNVDDSGVIAGATLTALNTAAAAWLLAMDTGGIPMKLEHFPPTVWVLNSNGQPRRVPLDVDPPSPTTVLSLTADSRAGTQRRRLRR